MQCEEVNNKGVATVSVSSVVSKSNSTPVISANVVDMPSAQRAIEKMTVELFGELPILSES
jgi:hypothetical protein